MIKKQNLRINVLAAAVLSMTAVGAVHAAGLPTREPVRQASAAQPGTDRIIVKYRAGSAAAGDRSAKLSAVQSALTRASLSGGTALASTLGPQVVRRLR
ncbi:protease, partial [Stenotrophomonas maltophilia]